MTGELLTGGVQPVDCPACRGTGVFEFPDGDTQPCAEWDCNGTGKVMGWAVEIDGVRIQSTDAMLEPD